jgi:SHS2 domain-containing protein
MKKHLPRYEEIEHPADIALRVRGRTMTELFRNAAEGMLSLMLDVSAVEPRQQRHISAEGDDVEALLVAWLSEVLFAFDANGFAACGVENVEVSEKKVSGRLLGEPFDPARHEALNLIKAVTWHNLKVAKKRGWLEVTIIFDV